MAHLVSGDFQLFKGIICRIQKYLTISLAACQGQNQKGEIMSWSALDKFLTYLFVDYRLCLNING
jgi:hypothetical protein